MPQKLKVKRLEAMALVAAGGWVKLVGRSLIEPVCIVTQQDPTQALFLEKMLAVVRETLFAMVPWYLFDKMAKQVLLSVIELVNETKSNFENFSTLPVFIYKTKVVERLTEIAMHPHIKQINVSQWPKPIRHILIKNLSLLTGIENLNIGSGSAGLDTTETEKCILSGVQSMTNLTTFCLCFDTTDAIISALGNTCPALQKLDITSSRSVTDRGLPALFNCKKLREVNLYQTSVTVAGFKNLLLKLPGIQNLGRCDEFGNVLEKLHEQNSNLLSLVALQCRNMTFEQLRLLVYYCRRLKSISLFHYGRIVDLTILRDLPNLNELRLLGCNLFSNNVVQLLKSIGYQLDLLCLEYVDEIDLNVLIYISQYCPNLKDIMFYYCSFSYNNPIHFDLEMLDVSPFAYLQRLVCVSNCSQVHIEFLMNHCKKVKYIQLGSSTGINDATISRVLKQNPMKSLEELRIQQSRDLSMQSVQLLMSHCDHLRAISELERWNGISYSQLEDFEAYIRFNNIDLDTTPRSNYNFDAAGQLKGTP